MHIVERQMKDMLDAVGEIAVCGAEGRLGATKVQRGRTDSAAGHLVHLTHLHWLNKRETRDERAKS
jgi:hypothetical protein